MGKPIARIGTSCTDEELALLEGVRILFVDDSPDMRTIFKRSMRKTGLLIDVADGPKCALEMAAKTDYPVIVTDLQMPGMNGLELVDRLWATNKKASFVLVTGIAELNLPTDLPSARAISSMVRKPWLPEQVHEALIHAMQLYQRRSEAIDSLEACKETFDVLLVEDDDIKSQELMRMLQQEHGRTQFRCTRVRRLGAGIRALKADEHDLVLTDLSLPDARGLDAVAGIRRAAPSLAIVVVSEEVDEDLAVQAVRAGAQDYLVRSEVTAAALHRTLRYAIERKSTEEHLNFLAYHDQLTELPNRRLFAQRATEAIGRSWNKASTPAILVLDLDRFKNINDSLGHSIGDKLLVEVAKRITECVGADRLVARLGGDEFAILLDGRIEVEQVSVIAQSVLEAMKEDFQLKKHCISTGASIGIALFPQNGTTIDQLLSNADAAMYRAKEAGRNRYQYFDEEMHLKAVEWMELEGALRGALGRNEFELHYQPQVNCKSGKVVCFEALLRWTHPVLGVVGPFRFIPVLESIGLIDEVGEWVLRQACQQLAKWRCHDPELRMAVNVSAVQFDDSELDQLVASAIDEAGIPADALEVEITEGLLMRDIDVTLETLDRLKKRGIRIAIDDFGTGYSNLSYLARFPIDVLKIDRSITSMVGHHDGNSIALAVIQLSHALGIEILAEGVETETELIFMNVLDVQTYQGYHFAKPMPVRACEEFMGYVSPAPDVAAPDVAVPAVAAPELPAPAPTVTAPLDLVVECPVGLVSGAASEENVPAKRPNK